jgi:hypothetical protein
MIDESCGIVARRTQRSRVIEQTDDRPRTAVSGQSRQGALACLAGTIHQDDAGVRKRLAQQGLRVTGDKIRDRSHPCILPHEPLSAVS